jgi:hypothetical protein
LKRGFCNIGKITSFHGVKDDDFFAGPGFTLDQYRCVPALCHPVRLLEYVPYLLAGSLTKQQLPPGTGQTCHVTAHLFCALRVYAEGFHALPHIEKGRWKQYSVSVR